MTTLLLRSQIPLWIWSYKVTADLIIISSLSFYWCRIDLGFISYTSLNRSWKLFEPEYLALSPWPQTPVETIIATHSVFWAPALSTQPRPNQRLGLVLELGGRSLFRSWEAYRRPSDPRASGAWYLNLLEQLKQSWRVVATAQDPPQLCFHSQWGQHFIIDEPDLCAQPFWLTAACYSHCWQEELHLERVD